MASETCVPTENQEVQDVERTRPVQVFRPLVDIIENTEELLILADMPGTSSEAIDINFKDGELTIYGRVTPRQADNTVHVLREYGVGDFSRTFQVSESINAAGISAEYADGVLKLHLPKVAAARPRKIEVQSK